MPGKFYDKREDEPSAAPNGRTKLPRLQRECHQVENNMLVTVNRSLEAFSCVSRETA